MAASNLKKQATRKNEGSLAYVKGGLSTFFEAQDALAGKDTVHVTHRLYTEYGFFTLYVNTTQRVCGIYIVCVLLHR